MGLYSVSTLALHHFHLVLLARASHMAECETQVRGSGRTSHQQWKNVAMMDGTEHGSQMTLSLTLKDKKEASAKEMHTVLG